MTRLERQPLGVIFNTDSDGRFDLLVYPDGLLVIKGTYLGVALRAAGAGIGVAGERSSGVVPQRVDTPAEWTGASSYEGKRIAKLLQRPRAEIIRSEPESFFIPLSSITGVVLGNHGGGCSVTVKTEADPQGRSFSWEPAHNDFAHVRKLITSAFGVLVDSE